LRPATDGSRRISEFASKKGREDKEKLGVVEL